MWLWSTPCIVLQLLLILENTVLNLGQLCSIAYNGQCQFMPPGMPSSGLIACQCTIDDLLSSNRGLNMSSLFLPVCYLSQDQWNVASASAVCRQVGLEADGVPLLMSSLTPVDASNGVLILYSSFCSFDDTSFLSCVALSYNKSCSSEMFAIVSCSDPGNAIFNGDIILSGRPPDVAADLQIMGRVNVYVHSAFGMICSDTFDEVAARVTCWQLGHSDGVFVPGSLFTSSGSMSNTIFYDNISCTGSEAKLSHCANDGFRVVNCADGDTAGVICTNFSPSCATGDIQLIGGDLSRYGRVEVCLSGIWGTVCSEGWSDEDASIVCQQLGFHTGVTYTINTSGSTGPIWYSNVNCSLPVNKQSSNCFLNTNIGVTGGTCTHSMDAGVLCHYQCDRLIDGFPHAGRLELCSMQNAVGTVCARDVQSFDDVAASVACITIGLSPPGYVTTPGYFGIGEGSIFFSSVQCDGSESRVRQCLTRFNRGASMMCNHTQDVGIACYDPFGCNLGELKLVESLNFPRLYHVKVCFSGVWGSICPDHWSDYNSAVMCRQLNLTSDVMTSSYILITIDEDIDEVIWLGSLACLGQEHQLVDCPRASLGVPRRECTNNYSVTLDCSIMQPSTTQPGTNTIGTTGTTSTTSGTTTSTTGKITTTVTTNGTDLTDLSLLIPLLSTGVGFALCIGAILSLTCTSICCVCFRRHKSHTTNLRGGNNMPMEVLTDPNAPPPPSLHDMPTGSTHYMLGLHEVPPPSYYEARYTSPLNERSSIDVTSDKIDGEKPKTLRQFSLNLSTEHLDLLNDEIIIESQYIRLMDCIGQGEYGIVYKAHLISPMTDFQPKLIAVKTLKGHFTQSDVDNLMEESIKMKEFKHTNVLGLMGVCIDAGSAPYVILPYMCNGSLLDWLKRERNRIVLSNKDDATDEQICDVKKELLGIALQIANGMCYLSAHKVIHRDLAARNCMMDETNTIKVSDFGLSTDIYEKDYFRQEKNNEIKLPIKWMAIESISDGVFSEKTDVWSFGVACWEVFSGGKMPYGGLSPLMVPRMLENGERLDIPNNAACTPDVYSLMQDCWIEEADDRPNFSLLVTKLDSMLTPLANYLDFSKLN